MHGGGSWGGAGGRASQQKRSDMALPRGMQGKLLAQSASGHRALPRLGNWKLPEVPEPGGDKPPAQQGLRCQSATAREPVSL